MDDTNSKKNGFKATIVDAVREWDEFKETIESKNIGLINLNNNSKFSSMKREGFFRSRLAYLYIFFKCFRIYFIFIKSFYNFNSFLIFIGKMEFV